MKVMKLLGAAFLLCISTMTMAGDKTEVCHIPPGNAAKFHTISVSEKAIPAHLAHGDFAGPCGQYAEVLCNDSDPCTKDAFIAGTESCEYNLPVDCNDGNSCTTNTCEPMVGCVDTSNPDGVACQTQGDVAVDGVCAEGICTAEPIISYNCQDFVNSDPIGGFCNHAYPNTEYGLVTCCPDGTCNINRPLWDTEYIDGTPGCPGEIWTSPYL